MTKTAEASTVELVSYSANLWVSLTTNVDDYSGLGGMRRVRTGERIKFHQGRALIPASMLEAAKATPGYGRDFWEAVDPRRDGRKADTGPQVVAGQLRARLPQESEPPLADWDSMGPRDIRAAIESGRVEDTQEALFYEASHRARSQVLEALGAARREETGQEDETEDLDGEGDGDGSGIDPAFDPPASGPAKAKATTTGKRSAKAPAADAEKGGL